VKTHSEFNQKLHDPTTAAAIDLIPSSRSLVIALAGVGGRLGMRQKFFVKAFAEVAKNRLFLRDLHKRYFLLGVPGFGDTIEELAASIKQLLAREEITHLTLVGNCMGGYAAIILGVLLNADDVHAFVPKTTLKWFHRLYLRDITRDPATWKIILGANLLGKDQRKYLDLKTLLETSSGFDGKIHIYTKSHNRSSLLHAARLKEFPQVTIHNEKVHKADVIRSL
jgi:hypothetical protein